MKRLLIATFVCLIFTGCYEDPSEEDLKRGRNIDIEHITGTVIRKEMKYFVGDQSYTVEQNGLSYLCLTVELPPQSDNPVHLYFPDVPAEVYDELHEGMTLPVERILDGSDLTKMEGVVADLLAEPELDHYYLVVNHGYGKIKQYRVEMGVYYDRLSKGLRLPLPPDF